MEPADLRIVLTRLEHQAAGLALDLQGGVQSLVEQLELGAHGQKFNLVEVLAPSATAVDQAAGGDDAPLPIVSFELKLKRDLPLQLRGIGS
jgi:hypothetical protein